eukprot:scaffold93526_cov63-Phaeocystis_antarctica.AAC.2
MVLDETREEQQPVLGGLVAQAAPPEQPQWRVCKCLYATEASTVLQAQRAQHRTPRQRRQVEAAAPDERQRLEAATATFAPRILGPGSERGRGCKRREGEHAQRLAVQQLAEAAEGRERDAVVQAQRLQPRARPQLHQVGHRHAVRKRERGQMLRRLVEEHARGSAGDESLEGSEKTHSHEQPVLQLGQQHVGVAHAHTVRALRAHIFPPRAINEQERPPVAGLKVRDDETDAAAETAAHQRFGVLETSFFVVEADGAQPLFEHRPKEWADTAGTPVVRPGLVGPDAELYERAVQLRDRRLEGEHGVGCCSKLQPGRAGCCSRYLQLDQDFVTDGCEALPG